MDLLEDSRRKHVFLQHYSSSTAFRACLDLAVRATATRAHIAYLLLVHGKFVLSTIIEVFQWNVYADFHIGSATLPCPSKVATAAEEAREHIEWILGLLAAPGLVFLHALMTVLIVNFSCIGISQCLERFCHLQKSLMGAFIATTE